MLRHLEICKPFQALFPDEYGKLFGPFPRAYDQKLPADEDYKLLKMTFGQLVFLSVKLGKDRKGKRFKFVSTPASALKRVLHSWRPFSKPGAQAISPSDYPPVRIPQFFYAGGVDGATADVASSGYDADLDTGSSSSSSASTPIRMPVAIADEQMQQDTPTSSLASLPTPTPIPTPEPEPFYPELYLPPHLLPPTCDPTYLAAAIAAHAPEIDPYSPLLNLPISALTSAGATCDWPVSDVAAFSTFSEYDQFLFEEGANDPIGDFNQDFNHMFYSCDTPLFSLLPENGLVPSQVFNT